MLGTLKTGPAGSSGLTRAVTRIGDSVLSGGFTELAGARIVERTVDVGPPVLVAYRLSASGLALLPAQGELAALARLNLAKAPTPTR